MPNTIPYERHEYPEDFYGLPDILPPHPSDDMLGFPSAPAPAPAPPAPPSPDAASIASKSVASKTEYSVASGMESSGFDTNSIYSK